MTSLYSLRRHHPSTVLVFERSASSLVHFALIQSCREADSLTAQVNIQLIHIRLSRQARLHLIFESVKSTSVVWYSGLGIGENGQERT